MDTNTFKITQELFTSAMHEMILNPNYNSCWILRVDILFDSPTSVLQLEAGIPRPMQTQKFYPNVVKIGQALAVY